MIQETRCMGCAAIIAIEAADNISDPVERDRIKREILESYDIASTELSILDRLDERKKANSRENSGDE